MGTYQDRIDRLSEAIAQTPERGSLYHNRGMANAKLERWGSALADFDRAIELDPQPTTYEQRGLVRYQSGDRTGAVDDWRHALRLDPSRMLALGNLGWLLIEDRRFDEAIACLNLAIAMEPTAASVYVNRARAYYDMGDLERAEADMRTSRHLVDSGQDTSGEETWE